MSNENKETSTPSAQPETGLVKCHELTGAAFIVLPEALRDLIGEEAYQAWVAELNNQCIHVVTQYPGDVIFIDLPVMVVNKHRHSTAAEQAAPAAAGPEATL
jgi:hypothetical protein